MVAHSQLVRVGASKKPINGFDEERHWHYALYYSSKQGFNNLLQLTREGGKLKLSSVKW